MTFDHMHFFCARLTWRQVGCWRWERWKHKEEAGTKAHKTRWEDEGLVDLSCKREGKKNDICASWALMYLIFVDGSGNSTTLLPQSSMASGQRLAMIPDWLTKSFSLYGQTWICSVQAEPSCSNILRILDWSISSRHCSLSCALYNAFNLGVKMFTVCFCSWR